MSIDIDKAKEAVTKILAEGGTETASVLWQSSGGKTYIIYPRTVAANVDMGDGSSALDRITLLERGLAGNTTTFIVENIAERDLLSGKIPGDKCYVIDATDDPTVEKGGASYIWMPAKGYEQPYWRKLGEDESQDFTLEWNMINGRPESAPGDIDDAVDAAHEHENKALLDKLAEDEDGLLTIDGKPVDDGKRDTVVTSDLGETIPQELRDGGLLITITE